MKANIALLLMFLFAAFGSALAGEDYLPFVADSQSIFDEDADLTQHYWRVPAYLRFAKLRATPIRLREISQRNKNKLAERDSGLSKFFATWKPEDPDQIFVPVFADRALLQHELVWVLVFNWEYQTAAGRDGKMSAGHTLVLAVRQSTGKVIVYQPGS